MADTPDTPDRIARRRTAPAPVTADAPTLTLTVEDLAAIVWRMADAALFPETPTKASASGELYRVWSRLLPEWDPSVAAVREPVRDRIVARVEDGALPGRDAW